MIDSEVERLRGLRATALRVRAIARALQQRTSSTRVSVDRTSLERSACAAWRIARTASGRLRAHPFAKYHKDASLAVVLKNEIAAKAALLRVGIGHDAAALFGAELRSLARELADARALTWATELSDSFGRSQVEIGSILAPLGLDSRATAYAVLTPARIAATPAGDWPYLAL